MTSSEIEKLADLAFSVYVRLRDSDWSGKIKCCTCNAHILWAYSHCGHWQKRGKHTVRYYERNAHAQCSFCNTVNDKSKAYNEFILKKYGAEEYDKIVTLGNATTQMNDQILIDIAISYIEKAIEISQRKRIHAPQITRLKSQIDKSGLI